MEHSEPGQVGNQAALRCHFHVSEPIPADVFLWRLAFVGEESPPYARQLCPYIGVRMLQ